MLNLNQFIADYVVKRHRSMFLDDIESNLDKLKAKIQGKSLLVIGGAGSIGSSFIRAILPFKPVALVVVDTNENALAELTRDLRSTKGIFVPEDYLPYPMDFSSAVFEKMFRARKGFDIVANFSAHKHVRSEKDIYSIEALLQNNLLHAKQLLDLLSEETELLLEDVSGQRIITNFLTDAGKKPCSAEKEYDRENQSLSYSK